MSIGTMNTTRTTRLRRTCCAILAFASVAPLAVAAPADASHTKVPRTILRMGDTGPLVKKAQRLLFVTPDGAFGRGTRGAVKHFQRQYDLLVDGQVGPQTWKALIRRAHKLRAAPRRGRSGDGVLTLGERGRAVAQLQRRLKVRITGIYDRRTYKAVMKFQRKRGLLVDGQAGPQTRRALKMRHGGGRSGRQSARGGGRLGAQVVRMTRRYTGIRYTWGGETPRSGFDCSGLVWYVFRQLGIDVPRVTYDQWHAGKRIKRKNLRPGDLLFFNRLEHVGIFAGHGWFFHAPRRGSVVHASRFSGWYRSHFSGAVRISR